MKLLRYHGSDQPLTEIGYWKCDVSIDRFAFSPDSKKMVLHTRNGTNQLLELTDNGVQLVSSFGEESRQASGLAISPDGKTVASVMGAVGDVGIRLWDVTDPRNPVKGLLLRGQGGGGLSLRFSQNSKFLISTGDSTVRFWNIKTGQELPTRWHLPGRVHGLARSPDGQYLATANGNGTVYVFRVPAEVRSQR